MAFTAVYDACVLYPAPLRDLLVQLAGAGLFRAKWTDAIHDEWIRNLLERRPDLDPRDLERTKELMNRTPDSLVTGYEHLINSVDDLPDEDDRHVVAAAIHARAELIVTFNLKDFPGSVLSRYNVEAVHPDDFITYQFDLSEPKVLVAAQTCRRRLKNPPKTAEEYLDTLKTQGLPQTVAALTPYVALI